MSGTPDPASRGVRPLGPSRAVAVARAPVVGFVTRRVAMSVVLLFVVTALSFLLVSLTPGDAARQLLGLDGSQDGYERLRQQLGLDLPLYEQYGRWTRNALSGDLGVSLFSGQPVTELINERLAVTLSLMFGALAVSVVVGVAIGALTAVRGGAMSRFVDALALLAFAIPSFWLGAVLISLFAVQLGWLPATGYVPVVDSPSEWLRHLVLPVLALAMGSIAAVARQTREAMLDALGSEYIRMAWANGVPARSIFLRHALKNAGVRVLTVSGVQAVGLLGGTVVIENVFALPGLGSLAVNATIRHDLPLIQGVVLYFTVMVVVVNLLIDIAYAWLNPRVRSD